MITTDKKGIGTKVLYSNTLEGITTQIQVRYNSRTDYIAIHNAFQKSPGWNNGSATNKKCPTYLGVTIAEQVLFNVFNHIERMPNNNKGFDFKCNLGYMIDVKSSTKRKNSNGWLFHINQNPIADYFLCLAFDDRLNLNPLHIWLIPSKEINHLKTLSISVPSINIWSQYELTDKLDKVITCCNIMKET